MGDKLTEEKPFFPDAKRLEILKDIVEKNLAELDIEVGFRGLIESLYPGDNNWVQQCVNRYRLTKKVEG